ncbi:MAG: hypothetical protein M3Q33_01430 [Acidobacteriota bacterium]|nr:hypothetical protein [Acidobacteriota bacterium]
MTTQTKNKRKDATNTQRTRNQRATNVRRTCNEHATNVQQVRYLFAPIMQRFRSYLRKDVANAPQIWLPIECNLIFRYEFAACSLQTRYIFVAILLYCGQRGLDEIPDDKRFLASALNADARTIEKAISELENLQLLVERKKEREIRKEQTDRQDAPDARVSVNDLNLSEIQRQSENGLLNKEFALAQTNGNKQSIYSIEECLRYVEVCQTKGEKIQSPKALANHLSKSGEADSFIMQTLYPKDAEVLAREVFGEPFQFINEPCAVCFGAKMADVDGKGFRACVHCINERGQATGKEPEGKTNNE